MKTLLLALFSLGTLAASLPAAAGPDWAVIERARAAARARQAVHCAQLAAAAAVVPAANLQVTPATAR